MMNAVMSGRALVTLREPGSASAPAIDLLIESLVLVTDDLIDYGNHEVVILLQVSR
jgi:hypothetical protein